MDFAEIWKTVSVGLEAGVGQAKDFADKYLLPNSKWPTWKKALVVGLVALAALYVVGKIAQRGRVGA